MRLFCLEAQKTLRRISFQPQHVRHLQPFSLPNTFDAMAFGSYWFATGTPFLILFILLKKHHYQSWKRLKRWKLRKMLTVLIPKAQILYLSFIRGHLTIKKTTIQSGLCWIIPIVRWKRDQKYLMPSSIDKSAEAPF